MFLALLVTLKFTYELALFTGLIDTSFVVFLIVCGVINWIALITFCKSRYGILFSAPNRKYGRVLDLDFKEISIIGTLPIFTYSALHAINRYAIIS